MGFSVAPPSGGVSMPGREARAVWALAFAQSLGYASFFYIFAALVLAWQSALDWGEGIIAAGPMLAIGVTALISPKVGRWMDRGHALRLMGGGTVLGAAGLGLLAAAWHPLIFLAAFAILGAAAAMTLYEVCFALMVRRFGERARGPITKITLIGGLASTLAFPAGAWLAEVYGWRGAVWAACAVVLLVMLPLQLWGAWVLGGGRQRGQMPKVSATRWRDLLAKPGALRLTLLLALLNLDHWMIVNLLRPLLDRMGIEPGLAVLAASVIGPSQVAGRLALMAAGDRLGSNRAAVMTVLAMILAAVALLLAGLGAGAILAFAVLQGAAMGVLTILRPVLVSAINGPQDYAAAAAAIALPGVLATAVAPMIGTGLMALGGPVLLLGAALALAGAALVLVARG